MIGKNWNEHKNCDWCGDKLGWGNHVEFGGLHICAECDHIVKQVLEEREEEYAAKEDR